MLELLLIVVRALALALRGHRELVLENLALRQQLTAMKRSANRPRLERGDRLFWIALVRVRQNWRAALVVVQPDTVVRWQYNRTVTPVELERCRTRAGAASKANWHWLAANVRTPSSQDLGTAHRARQTTTQLWCERGSTSG